MDWMKGPIKPFQKLLSSDNDWDLKIDAALYAYTIQPIFSNV